MHKNKLSVFLIDCQSDEMRRAAAFWGHALEMPVQWRTQFPAGMGGSAP
jgi:hypothetical protein